jgi:hypothetical protein
MEPRPAAPPAAPAVDLQTPPGEPSDATLGMPIYPGAQFVTSYDAGRGQRFYLFGTNVSFAEIVAYYRTVLRHRGFVVFDAPGTHMFEIGRYRDDAVAFPPSITVKDYSWGGSQGFLVPTPGADPARFRTIIQIVPAPPGLTGR